MTRKTKLDIAGAALIALCICSALAMGAAAYAIDRAHGITVHQSLRAWGL